MQPQQSLTALPYIESASLLDYKSEGESGLESESEDEWTETHSKKKKNAHHVGPPVVGPIFLRDKGQLTNIPEKLYRMEVGLALGGLIQKGTDLTLYRHETQLGNHIVVTPKSMPQSRLVWVGLFIFDPSITKMVRFPPSKANNNERAHGGIIGNTADLFANGGLALLRSSQRNGSQVAFQLGRDFKCDIKTKHAQFVLCLVPMEEGEYRINEAVRSEPFFVKSKRPPKTLGKKKATSTKNKEIQALQADFKTKIIAVKKVNDKLKTLNYKRKRLNNCCEHFQRVLSENGGRSSKMLCMALDMAFVVDFDDEEECV
tara:strand:- start:930 stop:1877 length:948 start_codon:yes stop_codon:yes gene_type:complete